MSADATKLIEEDIPNKLNLSSWARMSGIIIEKPISTKATNQVTHYAFIKLLNTEEKHGYICMYVL